MAKKTIFEYTGKVQFTPEEIQSNIGQWSVSGKSTRETPTGGIPDKSETELEYFRQLDATALETLEIDSLISTVEDMIADQTKDMRIAVDPNDRPSLAQAVEALGAQKDDKNRYILNKEIWDKAYNIMQNSIIAQFGFDPVTSAFSSIGPEGLNIPSGEGKVALTCDEAATPDPITYASTPGKQSYAGVQDRKDFNVSINALRLVLLNALKMALDYISQPFKKLAGIKLIKAVVMPIVRWFDKQIRWCDNQIKKMMPGLPEDSNRYTESAEERSSTLSNTADEGQTVPDDAAGEMSDPNTVNTRSAATTIPSSCTKHAQTIIDRVNDWALYDGSKETGGNINPSAILLKPIIMQLTNFQEVSKVILTIGDDSETIGKLRDNTKNKPRQFKRWQNPDAEEFRTNILRT